jgi:cysteinyl-tRNA synthetase
VNYRLPLNFTLDEGLPGARAALGRIDEWSARLTDRAGSTPSGTFAPEYAELVEGFFKHLDDDLNISGAMGQVFDLIRDSNRALDAGKLDPAGAAAVLAAWHRINAVLCFERDAIAIPAEVQALADQRQAARAGKNWAESDRLRDAIAALGWMIKDTKDGGKLTPVR